MRRELQGLILMRIVIAGASGFVGRQLIPILEAANADLLLVGRHPEAIALLYPHHAHCSYGELEQRAIGYDLLLNLAVMNNNGGSDLTGYREVNVAFVAILYGIAQRCKISRFVDISSVRALDENDQHPYALSKRAGTASLAELSNAGPPVTTLYLPALYHNSWAGKLTILNYLPIDTARGLFSIFASLKPTLDIARIADVVLQDVWPETLLLTDGQLQNRAYRFGKRTIDLAVASAVMIAIGWAAIPIWAAIRWTSRGPGIFAQQRVGRDGQLFTCFKFRTMNVGTEQVATHQMSNSAVTKVGAFLRRTKLDELPQVWNVLRNEMSLVGPRPCLPTQTELIEQRRGRGILAMTPGITGLAQINDIDMSDPKRLAGWDERYLKLQSLLLDVRIIFATGVGGGRGDRVRSPP